MGVLFSYEDVRAERKNKAARGPPKSWGALSGTPLHTCTHVCAHTHSSTQSRQPTACTAARMLSAASHPDGCPCTVTQSLLQTWKLSLVSPAQQDPQPPPFPTVSATPTAISRKGTKGSGSQTSLSSLAQQRGLLLTGFLACQTWQPRQFLP